MAKKGPPKHQNKSAWKNVYHDTSKKSKQIALTEVSGVCKRCKDVLDWRIKYKKYKVLTQPKTWYAIFCCSSAASGFSKTVKTIKF